MYHKIIQNLDMTYEKKTKRFILGIFFFIGVFVDFVIFTEVSVTGV